MKFGETLHQRSVPQWRSYNVDYAALKAVVKAHTSPSKAKATAVPIPGKAPSQAEQFEDQLLDLLSQECDRVDLFVKSKRYELASRLSSVERQIAQLQHRRNLSASRNAVGLRRRFSRLETEILRVGEEIQSLSRFIATNRLAIRKLVKKYQKWTKSTSLGPRVEQLVLDRPESFAKTDLATVMDSYAGFLADVRAAFEEQRTVSAKAASLSVNPTLPQSAIPSSKLQGPAIDFDLALDREGGNTKRAVYWVHGDNLVELRVLLLQYMRCAQPECSAHPEDSQQRRGSATLLTDAHIGTLALSHSMLSARWVNNKAAVSVAADDVHTIKLEKSRLASFLNVAKSQASPLGDSSDSDGHSPFTEEVNREGEWVKSWIENHSHVEPIARVCAVRSRYYDLEEGPDHGPKAALDEDIAMEQTSLADMRRKDYFKSAARASMQSFPHAVLTVMSSDQNCALIATLDQSHLTERVQNFSLAVHAATICAKSSPAQEPQWLPKLSLDIRHLPPASEPSSRKSSIFGSTNGNNSPKGTSRSATTLSASDGPITPNMVNTATFTPECRKKAQPHPLRTPHNPIVPEEPRYWNEYENPSSEFGGENDPFTIYIDPDAPWFPGQQTLKTWQKRVKSLFRSTRDRGRDVEQGLLDGSSRADPRRPLLDDNLNGLHSPYLYSSSEDGETGFESGRTFNDSSSSSAVGPGSKTRKMKRNGLLIGPSQGYGTLAGSKAAQQQALSRPSIMTATICLAAAAVITTMLITMASTARRKARIEVDFAVAAGVICSLLFDVLGVVGALRTVSSVQGLLGNEWKGKVAAVGTWRLVLGAVIAMAVAIGDGWIVAWCFQ